MPATATTAAAAVTPPAVLAAALSTPLPAQSHLTPEQQHCIPALATVLHRSYQIKETALWLQHRAVSLQQQAVWVLHHVLEALQEFCCVSTIHDPVVCCDVDLHHLAHTNQAVSGGNHGGLAATDSQDGGSACTATTDTHTRAAAHVRQSQGSGHAPGTAFAGVFRC